MNTFESALAKLAPKMKHSKKYATAVYGSLCNIYWIHKNAPVDWYDALEQQDLDHKTAMNVLWRRVPLAILGFIRRIVIKMGRYTEKGKDGFTYLKMRRPFEYLNGKLLSIEMKFWVWPKARPNWYYSCSWRAAGGIVADLRNRGEDYMSFYCSGNEGKIDKIFARDIEKLGWIPKEYNDI